MARANIYEELVVKINADTNDAHTKIEHLSSSLDNLQKAVKRFDLSHFEMIKVMLKEISRIKFDSLIMGLNSVVNAFDKINSKTFSTTRKALEEVAQTAVEIPKEIPDIDIGGFDEIQGAIKITLRDMTELADTTKIFEESLKQYSEEMQKALTPTVETLEKMLAYIKEFNIRSKLVKDNRGFDFRKFEENSKSVEPFKQNLTQQEIKNYPRNYADLQSMKQVKHDFNLDNMEGKLEKVSEKLADLGLNASQLEQVFKNLDNETKTFDETQINAVKKALEELGYSGEKVNEIVKGLKTNIDKTGKKATDSIKHVAIRFKSLALYRVLRLALMKIQQALGSAIQQLASMDSGFNDSVSRLSNSFKYLSNSLVAMFAPILKLITPIIELITDLVADLANTLGELFASMSGENTFTQATKGAEDYAESLKKVKTQALGIDELNVLSQQEEQSLFSTKDIEATNTFGEVFANIKKDLEGVVSAIKELFSALKPIIQLLGRLVKSFIERTSETLHKSITAFINALVSIIGFIAELLDMLEPILDIVNQVFSLITNNINEGLITIFNLIAKIFNILKPLLKALTPILELLAGVLDIIWGIVGGLLEGIVGAVSTIVEFIGTVLETIFALLSGDFNKIGDLWGDLGERLKDIWRGVGNFFIDVLNTLLMAIEKFANFFVGIAGKVASWFGVDTSNWGVHFQPIPKMANGGIVEDGLFFANHGELVGQFDNGKTAVANNEQITTGIYQAVLQAMRETQGGGVKVYLDGKEIADRVNDINDNRGATLYKGGNLSYGR